MLTSTQSPNRSCLSYRKQLCASCISNLKDILMFPKEKSKINEMKTIDSANCLTS